MAAGGSGSTLLLHQVSSYIRGLDPIIGVIPRILIISIAAIGRIERCALRVIATSALGTILW